MTALMTVVNAPAKCAGMSALQYLSAAHISIAVTAAEKLEIARMLVVLWVFD